MTRWTPRLALELLLAFNAEWLARGRDTPQRATRPLDLRSLSPHLARDIGLLDAGPLHLGGGAHSRMGQLHRLR